MSKASLSSGNGPGSSIALAPETIRVRDALVEKFNGAPLEEMTNFMTMALSNETDQLRRLGILAARIYILRNRVANLKEFNRNPSLTSLPALDTATLNLNLPRTVEPIMTEDDKTTSETNQWSRIQMTEPGEVNGVRFLAGTIIDAQAHDADKLIHSGKAVRVDVDGNSIDHLDDDSTDSDGPLNDSNEASQALDNDVAPPGLINDNSVPTVSDDASVSEKVQSANNADGEAEIDADGEAEIDADAKAKDDATQIFETADENSKEPTS